MGGPYSGGVFSCWDRSHGENGRHTPKSDCFAERRRSPSYDSYDRCEPDRRGRSQSPSYDCYDDCRDSSRQRPRRWVSPRDSDSRGALGPTANEEEEDPKMALHLSMQHLPPEPKQSKPRDAAAARGLLPEDGRRMQRELMATAAEKRMLAARSAGTALPPSPAPSPSQSSSLVSTTPNNEISLSRGETGDSVWMMGELGGDCRAEKRISCDPKPDPDQPDSTLFLEYMLNRVLGRVGSSVTLYISGRVGYHENPTRPIDTPSEE